MILFIFSNRALAIKYLLTAILSFAYAEGLIFDCIYSSIVWTRIGLYTYSCQVSAISSYQNETVEAVNGNHNYGMNNINVTALDVTNLTLYRLPSNLNEHFPSLVVIQCYATSLQKISSEDLQSLPSLRLLSLPHNEIVTLSGDLFQFTRSLNYIGFGFNVIEQIDKNLLDDLDTLQYADFQKNRCIDVTAASSWDVKQLNNTFAYQCPIIATTSTSTTTEPSTTVQVSECPDECAQRMLFLENSVVALSSAFEEQHKIFESRFNELNAKFEKFVLENRLN